MKEQKLAIKPEKNCKYYRKCSNSFVADCILIVKLRSDQPMSVLSFHLTTRDAALPEILKQGISVFMTKSNKIKQ